MTETDEHRKARELLEEIEAREVEDEHDSDNAGDESAETAPEAEGAGLAEADSDTEGSFFAKHKVELIAAAQSANEAAAERESSAERIAAKALDTVVALHEQEEETERTEAVADAVVDVAEAQGDVLEAEADAADADVETSSEAVEETPAELENEGPIGETVEGVEPPQSEPKERTEESHTHKGFRFQGR
jgi:hypothetical protein